MEEDSIKKLFDGFNPELTSDTMFMSRLQRNMEAVELVKRNSAAVRRRNKTAVVVAALAGFVTGVLLTLLLPHICSWFSTIELYLPGLNMQPLTLDTQLLYWLAAAMVSGITAHNAYEITISRLSTANEMDANSK